MADLSGLVLLRNDPVLAASLIAEAEKGNMDAQYAAGLIYAEGRGVEIDLVQAFFWLTCAVDQGDDDAELLRRQVGAQMGDEEFAAARRLVDAARRAQASPTGSVGRSTRH
jgi:TPR repeat protein